MIIRHMIFSWQLAHDTSILMAARGFMNEELMQCADISLVHSLTDRPWQMLVAGVSDQIRDQLVGPGIREFRLEIHRHSVYSL